MKITCDSQADAMTIIFREANVENSDELQEGLIADYDAGGNMIAIEILDASERVDIPDGIEFSILREASFLKR